MIAGQGPILRPEYRYHLAGRKSSWWVVWKWIGEYSQPFCSTDILSWFYTEQKACVGLSGLGWDSILV